MHQCKICHSKNISQQDKLYVCDSCQHGYRIYDGDIVEFHKKDYRNLHRRDSKEFSNNKVTKFFHDARKTIVNKRLSYIKNYLNKSDSILDIGSGAGTFAKIINPFVNSVDCLELDPRLIDESRRLGFKTFDQDFLTKRFATKYQTIFAWHVLEHIDDIHSFVQKCKVISDKYTIIEVPTNRKPSKNFEGHLHYFSQKSLTTIFESNGFDTISMLAGVQKPAILGVFKP